MISCLTPTKTRKWIATRCYYSWIFENFCINSTKMVKSGTLHFMRMRMRICRLQNIDLTQLICNRDGIVNEKKCVDWNKKWCSCRFVTSEAQKTVYILLVVYVLILWDSLQMCNHPIKFQCKKSRLPLQSWLRMH